MDYDEHNVGGAVLAPPWMKAFVERAGKLKGLRAWRGISWETHDRFHAKALISNPKKSKARSVVPTEEGRRAAERAFQRLLVSRPSNSQREGKSP